jgi:hypothetical protein
MHPAFLATALFYSVVRESGTVSLSRHLLREWARCHSTEHQEKGDTIGKGSGCSTWRIRKTAFREKWTPGALKERHMSFGLRSL